MPLDAAVADAAEHADWETLGTLLRRGAAADVPQVDGTTALHWAVHHDELGSVRRLLEAGARASVTNRHGVTPLELACVNGSEPVVTALLAAGANPDTRCAGGATALMTAARTGRPGPVNALLARGAAVDATDRTGQTALMWAAADGHTKVVRSLLDAGADPNARIASGFTAFLFAARNGRLEVVRELLDAGIDPNTAIETKHGGGRAPRNGTGPLLLAVENGHFELALELVRAGAHPNDERTGFTPLHVLTWVRKPDRGDGLEGQPPPDGSGRVTSLEFVRELVALGADVNTRLQRGNGGRGRLNESGATPFLLAARRADLDYLKLLVELGADPFLTNVDGAGAVMAAAGLGCQAPTEEAGTEAECVATLDYLIALGGEVNARDANGETAMHGAAYKSLPRVVELLATRGAQVSEWNHKNKWGWTPVMIAEGFRPGNFKPSVDTLAALHQVMREAGVEIPPPTPRLGVDPKVEEWDDPVARPAARVQ